MNKIMNKYSMHSFVYFYYCSIASFFPFLGYWFSKQHLSHSEMGLLFSIGPIIGLFIQPIWGMLGDRFGIEKFILITSIILTPWIALGYYFNSQHLYMYMISAIMLAIFSSPIGPISDTITLNHSKKYGQSYGAIRVLGSISFALTVLLVGLLYKHIGIEYMFLFYFITMYAVLIIIGFVNTSGTKTRDNKALFHGVLKLLSQREFLCFLTLIFIVSAGTQCYNVFFSVYLSKFGGEASENIGLLNTISALAELPFFVFSDRLIKKYGSFLILSFGALAGAVRWFILSFEPSTWVLMINQLLHGITFALFFTAAIHFVYEKCPQGTKTTGQTLFAIVYSNLSILIASSGGGWIIDQYGFTTLFQIAASFSLFGSVGFILLHKFIEKSNREWVKN